MNGNYLLDTNIIIGLLANELTIVKKIQEGRSIFIPAIVVGELYYGAEQSSKKQANIATIKALTISTAILECDEVTAMHYGKIKSQLKAQGTPIPENDIWIAAVSFHHSLKLITRDQHFKHIKGLNSEEW